ncbi:hypothetical protein PV458_29570 [Streptomyces sp. MN03-5084-2B]|nr:hypothetical protein [Streptomyces sp. MN03-5084-2B]
MPDPETVAARAGDGPAGHRVVLADPEDNLFCVCVKPAAEVRRSLGPC